MGIDSYSLHAKICVDISILYGVQEYISKIVYILGGDFIKCEK
jgi:hypothetical protein